MKSTSLTVSTTGPSCSTTDAVLKPGQEVGLDHLLTNPKSALWLKMGFGKTLTTLSATVELFDSFTISRVLVVSPLRVMTDVWPQEIAKWSHTHHLTHTMIRGTPEKRLALTYEKTDIHLINRELFTWLVEKLHKKWPYDMVVFDDTSLRSHSTKRFKSAKKIAPKTERIVELTGTPNPKGLLGLWPQLYLLDAGERLGRTFTKYKMDYFQQMDYQGYDWQPKEGAADIIHSKVSDICLSIDTEHEGPGSDENDVWVSMPEKLQKEYNELEKEFLLQWEDDQIVSVPNAAVLFGKLVQFANGAVYDEDRNVIHIHDLKLDALDEIIDSSDGSPLLIPYCFKFDLERLRARYPDGVELRDADDTIPRWNAGEINKMFLHPASAGHGLNMQFGGRTIAWFGVNPSLELYQQLNARLVDRTGQLFRVMIHRIVTRNTRDETILANLKRHDQGQVSLLEAVRADILSKQ